MPSSFIFDKFSSSRNFDVNNFRTSTGNTWSTPEICIGRASSKTSLDFNSRRSCERRGLKERSYWYPCLAYSALCLGPRMYERLGCCHRETLLVSGPLSTCKMVYAFRPIETDRCGIAGFHKRSGSGEGVDSGSACGFNFMVDRRFICACNV